MAFFDIAVLKRGEVWGQVLAHALCPRRPMPYARESTSCYARKAIPRAITTMIEEVRKPGFGIRVQSESCQLSFQN